METIYTTALSDQAQDGVQDAKDLGRDAVATGRNYLDDAKKSGKQTLDTARSYARNAVNSTGQKVSDIRSKASDLKEQGVSTSPSNRSDRCSWRLLAVRP